MSGPTADPEAVKKLEEIVLPQACEIAITAGAVLAERVPRLDDGKLIAAWGTAVDKIALRQGWARGGEAAAQATGAGDAVARILQALDGRAVTLTVRDANGGDEDIAASPH